MGELSRIQQKNAYENYMHQYFEYGLNGKEDLDIVLESILYQEVQKEETNDYEGFRVLTKETKDKNSKKIEELETLVNQYEVKKEELLESIELNTGCVLKKIQFQQLLDKINEITIDKYSLLYIEGARELFKKVEKIQKESQLLNELLEEVKQEKEPEKRKKIITNARNKINEEDIERMLQTLAEQLIELRDNTTMQDRQTAIEKIKHNSTQIVAKEITFQPINDNITNTLKEEKNRSKLKFIEEMSNLVCQVRGYQNGKQEEQDKQDKIAIQNKRVKRIINNAAILYNHLERFIVLNHPMNTNYYYSKGVNQDIKKKVENKLQQMLQEGKIQVAKKGLKINQEKYEQTKQITSWAREDVYSVLKWLNEVEQEDKVSYYLLWLENKYIRVENANDNKEQKQKKQTKIKKVAQKFIEYASIKQSKTMRTEQWRIETLTQMIPQLLETIETLEHGTREAEK